MADEPQEEDLEELLRNAREEIDQARPKQGELLDQEEVDRLLAAAAASQGAARRKEAPASEADEDGHRILGQSEIESLFRQAQAAQAATVRGPAAADDSEEGSMTRGDIEYLFNQAQQALESVDAPHQPGQPAALTPFRLEELAPAPPSTEVATLELIRDVELDVKIELGRTQMYLEDVLKLRKGAVVPLDKLAGDPVDIYVNGRLIARGEVLVLNDNFCVRVAELIAGTTARAG